jgi:undecaprenyl-diphosphatase
MNIFQAVLLGIIEGITEFLPISSTGHLMLGARFLGIAQTEFVKSFEIAIQSGAILAVLFLYGRMLCRDREIWKKILAAFFPTAVVGALLYKFIKGVLLDNTSVVLAALFIGGVVLIVFEYFHREKGSSTEELRKITYPQALAIGLFQALAVVPGVSRSAATIVGGLALGLKRKAIVEFSFLLAVPTLLAATALDMIKSAPSLAAGDLPALAVGFLVSGVVSFMAMRFLLAYIKNHTFTLFGFYRIALAVLVWRILK